MNLHAIVSGAIGTVNPFVTATIQRSNGEYTTLPDGSRVPSYGDSITASVQVQALTADEIKHLDGLNIQGVRRAIYLTGAVASLVRDQNEGGDLIQFAAGTFPEGDVWLIAIVLEAWSQSNWVKAAITLQNGA